MAKILIVDDDALVRQTILRILASAEHSLAEATNGREALGLFECQDFDLVITDILMPEMEGIETIKAIHRKSPATPILAISGGPALRFGAVQMSGDDVLRMAERLGAQATLAKPFTPSQLRDAVTVSLNSA